MSAEKQTTARRRPKIPEPALRTPTPVIVAEDGTIAEPAGGNEVNGNALGGGVVSFEPTVVEIDSSRSEREVIADNSRRRGRQLF